MPEITKHMPIAEILENIPDSVELMLDVGLHCIGCNANLFETLEEGMMGHGFSESQVDDLVERINALGDGEEIEHSPVDFDFKVKKMKEDKKNYYQLAGMTFTDSAYKAVHELGQKKGLQIRIDAGGCSGYTLKYDYQDGPLQDEKIYKLSKKIALYLSDYTFNKLYGSVVDFQSGLKGSGLTFQNPNVKGSCSCGTSWSF